MPAPSSQGEDLADVQSRVSQPVDFYPAALHDRLLSLLPQVGQSSAPTARLRRRCSFGRLRSGHASPSTRPVSGLGWYRLAEDGRLYLTSKCEHYHAPVGHASSPATSCWNSPAPSACRNATHNNTRGHLTRLLEERLSEAAGGGYRVINLETGSLAMEAALKLLLARFYRVQEEAPAPVYAGRTPVFLVIGNDDGGLQANYHGTTVLTQTLRGMWPELTHNFEQSGLYLVRTAIRPNSLEDLDRAFAEYERPPYKIAGFFHEIVMMNYGGAPALEGVSHRAPMNSAAQHDVPTVADEIQSCLWAPEPVSLPRTRPAAVVRGGGKRLPRRRISRLPPALQPALDTPAAIRRAGHQRAGRDRLPRLPGHHGAGPRRTRGYPRDRRAL